MKHHDIRVTQPQQLRNVVLFHSFNILLDIIASLLVRCWGDARFVLGTTSGSEWVVLERRGRMRRIQGVCCKYYQKANSGCFSCCHATNSLLVCNYHCGKAHLLWRSTCVIFRPKVRQNYNKRLKQKKKKASIIQEIRFQTCKVFHINIKGRRVSAVVTMNHMRAPSA